MFYTLEDEQTLWLGDERIAVVREIVGTYSYQLGAIVGNEWIKQSPVLVPVERRYDRSQSVDHVTREFLPYPTDAPRGLEMPAPDPAKAVLPYKSCVT